jgi:hypothetical protein
LEQGHRLPQDTKALDWNPISMMKFNQRLVGSLFSASVLAVSSPNEWQ